MYSFMIASIEKERESVCVCTIVPTRWQVAQWMIGFAPRIDQLIWTCACMSMRNSSVVVTREAMIEWFYDVAVINEHIIFNSSSIAARRNERHRITSTCKQTPRVYSLLTMQRVIHSISNEVVITFFFSLFLNFYQEWNFDLSSQRLTSRWWSSFVRQTISTTAYLMMTWILAFSLPKNDLEVNISLDISALWKLDHPIISKYRVLSMIANNSVVFSEERLFSFHQSTF